MQAGGERTGGDTVARLGGDEFVLLLLDLSDQDECERLLQRVLVHVAAPVHLGAAEARVAVSIGVALFHATPTDAANSEELLRRADEAMYAAKRAGRNRYQVAAAQ